MQIAEHQVGDVVIEWASSQFAKVTTWTRVAKVTTSQVILENGSRYWKPDAKQNDYRYGYKKVGEKKPQYATQPPLTKLLTPSTVCRLAVRDMANAVGRATKWSDYAENYTDMYEWLASMGTVLKKQGKLLAALAEKAGDGRLLELAEVFQHMPS